MEEAGLKGFVVSSGFAMFAPAGTPRPVIDRVNAAEPFDETARKEHRRLARGDAAIDLRQSGIETHSKGPHMRNFMISLTAAAMVAPVALPTPALARSHHHSRYYQGKVWHDSHGRLRCKRAADRDRRVSGRFEEVSYCNGADIATTESEGRRISCYWVQSSRSAVTGSTRVARCAGTRHARTVTASNTTAAIESVAASCAVTP